MCTLNLHVHWLATITDSIFTTSTSMRFPFVDVARGYNAEQLEDVQVRSALHRRPRARWRNSADAPASETLADTLGDNSPASKCCSSKLIRELRVPGVELRSARSGKRGELDRDLIDAQTFVVEHADSIDGHLDGCVECNVQG